jgi:hypothetical protein
VRRIPTRPESCAKTLPTKLIISTRSTKVEMARPEVCLNLTVLTHPGSKRTEAAQKAFSDLRMARMAATCTTGPVRGILAKETFAHGEIGVHRLALGGLNSHYTRFLGWPHVAFHPKVRQQGTLTSQKA